MRFVIAGVLCAFCTGLAAEPLARWGLSTAVLSACPDADACLTVTNALSASPDVVDAALTLDGMTITLHVVMGIGARPDTATVGVPVGFRVEPATAIIDEGRGAVFRIWLPQIG